MSNLSQRIADLSPEQRVQLLQRLQQSAQSRQQPAQPARRERVDTMIPLSFAQQRLWFLQQLEPQSSVYHMHMAFRLYGRLNSTALEQSLVEIIERHEVLRTTFPVSDGEAHQAVSPETRLVFATLDLRELPQAEREPRARALALEEKRRPFDLEHGPLLRAAVFRLGDEDQIFLLTMHHIISDGWSIGVLTKEIETLYRAFASGRTVELAPLPIQYADFTVWQQQWLQGGVLAKQLDYWRQQLHEPLPVLQLPTDRPRPATQTFNGACLSFLLPRSVSDALVQLGQRESTTLFITLLAAFNALLARYTGQDDILVGTPIANRNRREIEELIGFFVNTQVLRTDLTGDPSFRTLLSRVRKVALEAYSNQDVPFEKLVDELRPERDSSRSPIFQVMFTLQQAAEGTLALPGLSVKPIELDDQTAKFDLTLSMRETQQGLSGNLEYNCDLFEAGTIAHMRDDFQTLLQNVATMPDLPLSRIPIMTQSERVQVLTTWNTTERFFALDQPIHQIFEEQATRLLDTTAVTCDGQRLSYSELNERANQMAHYLRTLGVGPEARVGVYCERSVGLVVTLLAIFKAGGAFVPLDLSLSPAELQLMIEDAQLAVVVTQAHLVASLTPCHTQLVCLDHHSERIGQEPVTPLDALTSADNLAYLIYASSTTGQPQAVQITQSALMNLLLALDEQLSLTATDTLLAVSALSSDIAALEIFLPLISGALLALDTENDAGIPLPEQMEGHNVTILQTTPTTWRRWLERETPTQHRPRIQMLWSDALLSKRLAADILEQDIRLWNVYGLSETTIWSSMQAVDQDLTSHEARGVNVPIGRPIANTQMYVLDAHLEPTPIGVPGALYIGGAGLARGYLNQPALTAERFVPHPFAHEPGLRLYKTGDIVRYLPDGSLEFMSRSTGPVRGQRDALGEIEAVLRQHPAVQQAVVLAKDSAAASGDTQLIAYIESSQPSPPTSDQLRSFLEERLPESLIPDGFVLLEALPLTPDHTIDRAALAALDRAPVKQTYVPPQDALQAQLVRIWESTLDVRPISITDNFFDIGGNSLLAIRVMARIKERMGQSLPLTTLFAAPTIETLVVHLHGRKGPGVLGIAADLLQIQSPLVKIQPNGTRPPFFFVAPLGGVLPSNVLIGFLDLVPYFGPDQPFYGLQLPGVMSSLVQHLDANQLPSSAEIRQLVLEFKPTRQIIESAAATCVAAIRSVQPEGPYMIGGFCSGGIVAFEMAQQLQQQGQQVSLLAMLDAGTSLAGDQALDHDDTNILDAARERIAEALDRLDDPDTNEIAWFVARDLGWGRLKRSLPDIRADLRRLDPADWWQYSVDLLKQVGQVAMSATAPEIQRLYYIYQINLLALRYVLGTYVPRTYAGRITQFRADGEIPVDDPTLGWSTVATEIVDIQDLPGDHGLLFREPNIQTLAAKMRACFAAASEGR